MTKSNIENSFMTSF